MERTSLCNYMYTQEKCQHNSIMWNLRITLPERRRAILLRVEKNSKRLVKMGQRIFFIEEAKTQNSSRKRKPRREKLLMKYCS